MKQRDDIIAELAEHALASATMEDLQQVYFEDQFDYFNDLPVSELKGHAITIGLIEEDEEIE
jgi:hypothetical protein